MKAKVFNGKHTGCNTIALISNTVHPIWVYGHLDRMFKIECYACGIKTKETASFNEVLEMWDVVRLRKIARSMRLTSRLPAIRKNLLKNKGIEKA